jgi:hypothetical protein
MSARVKREEAVFESVYGVLVDDEGVHFSRVAPEETAALAQRLIFFNECPKVVDRFQADRKWACLRGTFQYSMYVTILI